MLPSTYLEDAPDCVKKFVSYFENLNDNEVTSLSGIYDDRIIFQDPIHRLDSISAVTSYFQKLNKNLKSGGFNFTSVRIVERTCYLEWVMKVELHRPKKEVSAKGISVLTYEDKITYHRDYFDAGELFYENVPVLGGIIRMIKQRLFK